MRWVVLGAALALAACGNGEEAEERAAADARAKAAGFTPPQVTSRADWGGRQERRFRELDRNADNRLTSDELPRADSRITRFDRDRDGDVSQIEFNEGSIALFDKTDLNRDGTVTSEELETARDAAGR